MALEPVRRVEGPIIGYRFWGLKNGRLRSPILGNDEWPVGMAIKARRVAWVPYWLLTVLPLSSLIVLGMGCYSLLVRHYNDASQNLVSAVAAFAASVLFKRYLSCNAECEIPCTKGIHQTGVHAYRFPWAKDTTKGRAALFGSVDLWGPMAEHQGGYRALYAYPREITDAGCGSCGKMLPVASLDPASLVICSTCTPKKYRRYLTGAEVLKAKVDYESARADRKAA